MNQALKIQGLERFQLTPKQANIYQWGWQENARFRFAVCGRRFGKTFLIREEILRAAKFAMTQGVPEQNEIWYGAPTFKQAKRVFWKLLKKSIPRQWLERGRWNETDHCGTLVTGHVIRIVGLDNYDDLRGSGLFFFVGDEWDDAQPECWSEVVRPMLSTSNGHAIFIGSPKGFAALHDGYVKGQPGGETDTKSWKYTTLEGGNVPQKEIDRARKELDPRTFRQEYEAGFETFAGQVYYSFNRRETVKPCPYNSTLPIHIGMDFNVNPMSATVWQQHLDGDDWQVDEIEIPTADTVIMSDEIIRRYGKAGFDPSKPDLSHITIYPDPAGAQRRTSAQGKTDIGLLWEKGFVVRALASHPLVRDRVNIMNARFQSADQKRRSFVDPKCRRSIECLERQTYKEGTSEPDKDGGWDHMNDSSGYMFYARYGQKPTFRTQLGHIAR
jgi:hypothetical protein